MDEKRDERRRIEKLAKTILLTVVVWYILWFSLSALLRTNNPIVFVGLDPGLPWNECSMTPTLNPGDMLLLEGVPSNEIKVGDIIVLRSPVDSNQLIVHRVVEITFRDGEYYFTTKGDNLRTNPWSLPYEREFPARYIIGKVIFRVPFAGWIWIIAKTPTGTVVLLGCIVVMILREFSGKAEETTPKLINRVEDKRSH
jgi:signal peptidase I